MQHDRVVPLQERVHKLGEVDFDAALVAIGEVVPLQHLGYRFVAEQSNGIAQVKLFKPLSLIVNFGQVTINDSEKLLKVGSSVGLDLLRRKWLTCLLTVAGIAQAGRPVTDDDHGFMTKLLKLTQLAENYSMSNRHIVV